VKTVILSNRSKLKTTDFDFAKF